jgi:hypothetical protein
MFHFATVNSVHPPPVTGCTGDPGSITCKLSPSELVRTSLAVLSGQCCLLPSNFCDLHALLASSQPFLPVLTLTHTPHPTPSLLAPALLAGPSSGFPGVSWSVPLTLLAFSSFASFYALS